MNYFDFLLIQTNCCWFELNVDRLRRSLAGTKCQPKTAIKGMPLMKAVCLENQLCIMMSLCYFRFRSSYSCEVVLVLPALPNDHKSFTSSRRLAAVRT